VDYRLWLTGNEFHEPHPIAHKIPVLATFNVDLTKKIIHASFVGLLKHFQILRNFLSNNQEKLNFLDFPWFLKMQFKKRVGIFLIMQTMKRTIQI
jgi:hypothetical protein